MSMTKWIYASHSADDETRTAPDSPKATQVRVRYTLTRYCLTDDSIASERGSTTESPISCFVGGVETQFAPPPGGSRWRCVSDSGEAVSRALRSRKRTQQWLSFGAWRGMNPVTMVTV